MAGKISLHSSSKKEYTFVSNLFIDHYMPQANGAYVKVYLYLLRLLSGTGTADSSLSVVADFLDETEKDIERALKYWEKQKLLRLERSSNSITGIEFLDPDPAAPVKTAAAKEPVSPAPEEPAADTTATPVSASAAAPSATPASAPAVASTTAPASAPAYIYKWSAPEKPNYSAAQIRALTSLDEVKWLNTRLEQVTGNLLKPADTQLVLYLYESVGFPADLIVYLYEYCVAKNKRNTSYIESVAIAWAENGINTVQKAQDETATYNACYNAVNRAFGLNRAPGAAEIQFLQRWNSTFGFDSTIIEEACNRTLLSTAKPDFKYADKILTRWHDAGVKCREDIAALDAEFARKNTEKNTSVDKPANNHNMTGSGNRFNAFPQRRYTADDYSDMEKRLLNQP